MCVQFIFQTLGMFECVANQMMLEKRSKNKTDAIETYLIFI